MGPRDVGRFAPVEGLDILLPCHRPLVKHLAGVEAEYFGVVFNRSFPGELTGLSPRAGLNEDMWAQPGESQEAIVSLYQRAWAHADATTSVLPLDASGRVPWWRETSNPVSLARILVYVTAETHRHAGHADIVRELADGSVGHRDGNDNMAAADPRVVAGVLRSPGVGCPQLPGIGAPAG